MADQGTGKTDGTVPAGDNPAGGNGGGAGTGGSPKSGDEGGQAFNREELHPALRGMSPGEITELFETMATTIRTVSHPPAGTQPTGQQPPRQEPPRPAPKQRTKEDWKRLLDPASEEFDPESVITEIAQRNYGGLLGEINGRAIRGLYAQFKSEFPDFGDYEQDITNAFQGVDPATINERSVLTAYFTAKGARATMKEKQAARQKTTTTREPTPNATPKEPELTDTERQIAHKMFRNSENPEADYKKFAKFEDGMEMQVPIGGGKKG